jgi:hypothetical protein
MNTKNLIEIITFKLIHLLLFSIQTNMFFVFSHPLLSSSYSPFSSPRCYPAANSKFTSPTRSGSDYSGLHAKPRGHASHSKYPGSKCRSVVLVAIFRRVS